jgi:hypothetical protein
MCVIGGGGWIIGSRKRAGCCTRKGLRRRGDTTGAARTGDVTSARGRGAAVYRNGDECAPRALVTSPVRAASTSKSHPEPLRGPPGLSASSSSRTRKDSDSFDVPKLTRSPQHNITGPGPTTRIPFTKTLEALDRCNSATAPWGLGISNSTIVAVGALCPGAL